MDLRECLGKAAFEAHVRFMSLGDSDVLSWDMVPPDIKEQFMDIAKAVVAELASFTAKTPDESPETKTQGLRIPPGLGVSSALRPKM